MRSLTTAGLLRKMAEFHRLGIRKFPKVSKSQTSETRYWRKLSVRRAFFCLQGMIRKHCFIIVFFQFPIVVKEYGAVSHVDFCRSKPHDFVVTSSSRVSISPFSLFDTFSGAIQRSGCRVMKMPKRGYALLIRQRLKPVSYSKLFVLLML